MEPSGPVKVCNGIALPITLAFALQLREKHGKTSVRVNEIPAISRWQYTKKAKYRQQ
jgi:hypothetical protein